jgi:transposase-like protein
MKLKEFNAIARQGMESCPHCGKWNTSRIVSYSKDTQHGKYVCNNCGKTFFIGRQL